MALLIKNLRYKRIKAFSLVESIVALLLILLVFFISIHFFISVNESGFNMQRMNAEGALNNYIQISFARRDFSIKKEIVDNWPVSRENSWNPRGASLLQVQFTVYKKDSLGAPLLTRRFLVNIQTLSNSQQNAQP